MCCFHYCVHHILHHTTSILGKKSWCRGWFVRKAVYIKLHPYNVNLEHRYTLSMSLKKRGQQILSKDKTFLSPSRNIHLHMPSYIWLQLYYICMFSVSVPLSVLEFIFLILPFVFPWIGLCCLSCLPSF